MRPVYLLPALLVLFSCSSTETGAGDDFPIELDFTFETDREGFEVGFADYPADNEDILELSFGWAALPEEVGPGGALALSGNNRADDLFMFINREIDGLPPSAPVEVDIDVRFATNAPSDCLGIGGAPGTSVYVKAGAVATAPSRSVDDDGWWRMDLDKGNQAIGGADAEVIGHFGNDRECPDETYQLKSLSLEAFALTTNANGSIFVVIGTDSGHEGTTAIYYDRVSIVVRSAE